MQSLGVDCCPVPEYDMALNNTDKAWITLEIQTALKRKGWGKLTGFIKDWGGFSAAMAIFLFTLTQWSAYVEFRTHTQDRLDSIETRLAGISASIELLKPHANSSLPQLLKDNLASPKDPQLGLKTVKALVAQAKEQNISADPKQIGDVGSVLTSKQGLFTTKRSDDAWKALTGLLDYYTILTLPSLPRPVIKAGFVPQHYDFGGTYGKTYSATLLFAGGTVPIDQAAIAEHIINPQRSDLKEGPQTVVVEGISQDSMRLQLDGHHLKNVVIMNATIEYDGGPVILENVTFVKCVFMLAPQPSCVSFGQSLFASNPVNFKNLG